MGVALRRALVRVLSTLSTGLTLGLVLLLPLSAFASSGITYQGRILKKDGTPLESSSVQFKIQIRSPGAQSCLMYEEIQTKNMTGSAGVFSITINDGTGQRTDNSGINTDSVFANRGTYTFAASACATASTSYTPNADEGRSMVVMFQDQNMVAYEQLPVQAVNFVPMAIQAKQIAGFGPTNLLRVDDTAAAANTTPFNSAQLTELNALLGGTSTQYVHSSNTGGAALPVIAGAPSSTAAAGTIWYDSGSGALKYSNGTATPVVVSTGAGGGGGGVSSITVGSGLVDGTGATGTAITVSGTIALPAVGSIGSYYKVTTDAQGRVASGSASLLESDIPSLVTAGKVSGNTITSGTISGTTGVNTSGNILTSGAVSSGTSSMNTLRVFESTNTHKVSITAPASLAADYALVLPTALPGTSGQVLTSDTSGNLSWAPASSGSITAVTGAAPIVSSGGTAPAISITQASTSTNGYVSSSDWNTFNGKLGPTLTSGNLFVGNSSNVATGVAVSGDVALTNAGVATVSGVKGKAVSAAPTSVGQVLRYDGTNWTPNFVSMFDLRSTVTGTQAFSGVGCLASQTLTWTSATDNLSCSNIAVSGSQVTYASQTANTFFAAPNGSNGAPSFRGIASTDLPAGTLSGSGTAGYLPYYSAGSTLANSPIYASGSNVGIGTTSPSTTLTVNGPIMSQTTSGQPYLMVSGASGTYPGLYGKLNSDSTSRMGFEVGSSNNPWIFFGPGTSAYDTSISRNAAGKLYIGNGTQGDYSGTLVAGNVGIGTTSPKGTLDVEGGTAASGAGSPITLVGQSAAAGNNAGGNIYLNPGSATGAGQAGAVGIGANSSTNIGATVGQNGLYAAGAIYANNGLGTNYQVIFGDGTQNISGNTGGGYMSFTLASAEKMRVTSAGYVGIGTTSPLAQLSIGSGSFSDGNLGVQINASVSGSQYFAANKSGGYGFIAGYTNGVGGYTGGRMGTVPSDPLILITNNSERMRIDPSGNVGVGTTSPGYKLDVNGDINIASSSALRFGGTSVCTSAGCASSSDRTLKEHIQPLQDSIDKVLKLQGVEYDYKDKTKFTDKHQVGVIAQDVEKLYPEVVNTDSKTGLKSVAYDHLVAPLIEAFKTLYHRVLGIENHQASQDREIASVKAENAELKTKAAKFERENAEMKARLEKIEKMLNSK